MGAKRTFNIYDRTDYAYDFYKRSSTHVTMLRKLESMFGFENVRSFGIAGAQVITDDPSVITALTLILPLDAEIYELVDDNVPF